MKRRVIRHGRSTVIISLPSTWVKKYGIDKGDEVEVKENGNALEICADRPVEFGKIELDLNGLSIALICSAVKSAYLNGFDQIDLTFSRPYLDIGGSTVAIKKVVNDVVKELVGVEITGHTSSSCTIKEVSATSLKEFDSVLRRVFLLLAEALADVTVNSMPALENACEECLSVQKLVNYCLRCLNRHGYPQFKKSCSLFHILATANLISAEMLKRVENFHVPLQLDEEEARAFNQLSAAMRQYSSSLFKLQQATLTDIEVACNRVIEASSRRQTPALNSASRIVNLLWDMTQYRIGIQ